MKEKTKVAEVVEGNTSEFVAQCYLINQPPALGSLLKVRSGEINIFAVVKNATTAGIETGRYPLARGKDMAEEEEVFRANPQVLKLLRTLFTAQVVGYRQNSLVYQRFPPWPPRLHGFVFPCEKEETQEFGRSYDFLSLLLSFDSRQDQVVVACLRKMAEVQTDPHAFLLGAGKRLAQSLGREVERLNYLLRSIR